MVIEITRRKLFVLLSILVVLIAVPLTVYLSQRQQETQSHASQASDSEVIATINGENITRGDVRNVAREQYDDSSINQQALSEALATLEERKILDIEATRKSITADSTGIQSLVDSEGLTQEQAKYEILKGKITLQDVKNWQVYVIGFWVPPSDQRAALTKQEASSVSAQLSQGASALSEAEKDFPTQDDAVSIARNLISKYPALSSILGVNGYILAQADQASDLSDLTSPRVYTHDPSGVGQPFYDALYAMSQPGEVKKVLSDNNSGGNVIKLIQANTTASYNTYGDWLSAQEKTEVVPVKAL